MEFALGASAQEHALLELDIEDARRHLPGATDIELHEFSARQIRARRRLTDLVIFYRAHPCPISHLHVVSAAAVALGRSCGFFAVCDEMAEAFMPATADGTPRTAAWRAYAEACDAGLAPEARDELWLEAHYADLAAVRARGLESRFLEQMRGSSDPTFRLLAEHMQVAFGARLIVGSAISGTLAYDMAAAQSLGSSVARLFRTGCALLRSYTVETARALLDGSEPRRAILSNRQTALLLLSQTWLAFRARHVYRRGLRARERGRRADAECWPLLLEVLGDRVREVDPSLVRFYSNPSRFQIRASLELHGGGGPLWPRAATLLLGQGPRQEDGEFDGRFRVSRRADGSMHFARELSAGGAPRVFDSDFVVRARSGKPTLFEVFVDHGMEVAMRVAPLEGGGLSMRGEQIRWHGVPLPLPGLRLELRSTVERGDDGVDSVLIDSVFALEPRTRFGRFLSRTLLRRLGQLARVRYRARLI